MSVMDREADPDRQEAALKLRLVHVREQTQPEGAERLEWFLLTTLAVQTQQAAGAGAGVVQAALAHRGLASGAEVRLQGGVPGALAGGAHRAGGDDQRSDRLAADADDSAGTGHAGTAGGTIWGGRC